MIKESAVEGQSKNFKKRELPEVIEISSDEEEYQPHCAEKHRSKITKVSAGSAATGISTPLQSESIMQNKCERMKLESERLARQHQRAQLGTNPTGSSSRPSHQVTPRVPNLDGNDRSVQHYWKSTVKPTFNRWYPDSPHAIRIEDLIGPKKRIKMAIVSSYVVQLAWIHDLFDPNTRIMVIKHDPEPGTFKVNERDNMFLCHPPMLKTANGKARAGCMHAKFFLIFYDDFCRVAIPTANAVDFDYEVIENSVWIQDFRRSDVVRASPNTQERHTDSSPFEKTLQDLLKRMGVPATYYKGMQDYDFGPAAASLIVSIQGRHPVQSSYGQVGLAKELKTLGLQSGPGTGRSVTLECQGSSVGSFDIAWIKRFYCCASGYPPNSKASDSHLANNSTPSISVLFPTLHTIKRSKTGLSGGGTIFCNKATWQKPNFPTHIFADAISKRLGILMHVKMVLGIFNTDSPDGQVVDSSASTSHDKRIETENEFIQKDKIGFLYIGSHNFTSAAWGKIDSIGSNLSPQVEISNWELGVVQPLSSNSELEQYVPWQRPPKKYGYNGSETKIPWMQFSHRR